MIGHVTFNRLRLSESKADMDLVNIINKWLWSINIDKREFSWLEKKVKFSYLDTEEDYQKAQLLLAPQKTADEILRNSRLSGHRWIIMNGVAGSYAMPSLRRAELGIASMMIRIAGRKIAFRS